VNSETLIQEGLRNAIKDKTVLIIAHRLSTIINAAKIVVLSHGEVVGLGKHDELMQTNTAYRKLFQSQL